MESMSETFVAEEGATDRIVGGAVEPPEDGTGVLPEPTGPTAHGAPDGADGETGVAAEPRATEGPAPAGFVFAP